MAIRVFRFESGLCSIVTRNSHLNTNLNMLTQLNLCIITRQPIFSLIPSQYDFFINSGGGFCLQTMWTLESVNKTGRDCPWSKIPHIKTVVCETELIPTNETCQQNHWQCNDGTCILGKTAGLVSEGCGVRCSETKQL